MVRPPGLSLHTGISSKNGSATLNLFSRATHMADWELQPPVAQWHEKQWAYFVCSMAIMMFSNIQWMKSADIRYRCTFHMGTSKAIKNQVLSYKGLQCTATQHKCCALVVKGIRGEGGLLRALKPSSSLQETMRSWCQSALKTECEWKLIKAASYVWEHFITITKACPITFMDRCYPRY